MPVFGVIVSDKKGPQSFQLEVKLVDALWLFFRIREPQDFPCSVSFKAGRLRFDGQDVRSNLLCIFAFVAGRRRAIQLFIRHLEVINGFGDLDFRRICTKWAAKNESSLR